VVFLGGRKNPHYGGGMDGFWKYTIHRTVTKSLKIKHATDLVVNNNMNGSMCCILRQSTQMKCLIHHALSRKCCISMDKKTHHLTKRKNNTSCLKDFTQILDL